MVREASPTADETTLTCRGCGRTVRSDVPAPRLAAMVSWERQGDGDWCVLCLWRRGQRPPVARRMAGY